MFGFLIGTASLIGLIYVLRGGRHCRAGMGRFGDHSGKSWFTRRIFQALDTTPGQEKEIRNAVDELFEDVRSFKKEFSESRVDVARAVRGEFFDETTMGELFARHDDGLDKLRRAVVGALARVHAVLDEHQRTRLAELIESGMRGGFGARATGAAS